MKKANFLKQNRRSAQKGQGLLDKAAEIPGRNTRGLKFAIPRRLEPKSGEFLNIEFVQISHLNRSAEQKQQNAALAFTMTCWIFLEIFSPQYRQI